MSDIPSFPVRRESPFEPPAVYADWRREAAAKKVRLPNGMEAWALTRHADVRTMLSEYDRDFLTADRLDPKFPNLRQGVIGLSTDSNVVFMDEPEHGRIRRMFSPLFTAKKAAAMRPGIAETVSTVLDGMLAQGSAADLHQSFSLPIPSLVICQLLGISYDDHELFERLTGDLLSRATSREVYASRLAELEEYMSGVVDEKAKDPSLDDFIGYLLAKNVSQGELTRRQVVGLSMLMLIAGHETTAGTLSMIMAQLLSEPGRWQALCDDPSTAPAVIEEMIRAHSINDLVTLRLAVKDFEVGGCPIKAGEGVFGLGAAANHDPSEFPNPTDVDPSRNNRTHVGFGFGLHACPGQNLARAELDIALTALATRVPSLKLAGSLEELSFKHDGFVFGVTALPVEW